MGLMTTMTMSKLDIQLFVTRFLTRSTKEELHILRWVFRMTKLTT